MIMDPNSPDRKREKSSSYNFIAVVFGIGIS